MKELKVGDRVRVYGRVELASGSANPRPRDNKAHYYCNGDRATVVSLSIFEDIVVKLDATLTDDDSRVCVHSKQCRRLKPRAAAAAAASQALPPSVFIPRESLEALMKATNWPATVTTTLSIERILRERDIEYILAPTKQTK